MMQRRPHSPAAWMGASLGLAVLVVCLTGLLLPATSGEVNLSLRLASPSWQHPLGCDTYGRDLWWLCAHGALISARVVVATLLLSASIGVITGMSSALAGSWIDAVLMAVVDFVMTFPSFLLSLATVALFGSGVWNMVLAMSAGGWAGYARLVRGETLRCRELPFVTASQSLGATGWHVCVRHLFPHTWPALSVTCTFSVASILIVESSLSFLGLAGDQAAPSWGRLLSDGKPYLLSAPHLSLVPGMLLMATILALNFLAQAMRRGGPARSPSGVAQRHPGAAV